MQTDIISAEASAFTNVELGAITRGDNPRLPTNLEIAELSENIGNIGLLDPIHGWYPRKGVFELIRGHRRVDALIMLQEKQPDRFKELFPNGIRTVVYKDISKEQALLLKLDHAGQVPLKDPYELQMSATMMFNEGFTEAQVANQLKPLILKISPMPPSARSDLAKIEAKIMEAREKGDLTAVAVHTKEHEERVAKLYRGRMQGLHAVARCPDKVNAALYFKACGIKPKGFEEVELPKLTTDNVNALWKAHSTDLEAMGENGAPKWNKSVTGPVFNEKWAEILQKESEASSKGAEAPREKAMSAKDMTQEVKDGKWQSVGFYKLTKHHSGDKSVEGLSVLDKNYRAMDLIEQYASDLFEMVITESAKIEAGLKNPTKE